MTTKNHDAPRSLRCWIPAAFAESPYEGSRPAVDLRREAFSKEESGG
ncbi:hypothetical protein ACL02S_23495 [Nocardia sp. 004]